MRERGEVSLVWPYKDCVLEGGQTKEEEKRKEIFFNEILAQDEIDQLFDPKVLTNWKRYSPDGEQKVTGIKRDENGIILENLIIKGNNLLVLHTLKTQFRGMVKLIYIDPPYNTGSDSFGYNNNFNHSSWLTFMKSRLEISKELLRKDGAIVIHCDFVEDKVLMDEIFGRDNFVNSIAIRDSHPSGLKLSARDKTIVKTKSTILVYKNGNEIKINPVYQRRHEWDKHFNAFINIEKKDRKRISLSEYIKKNKIVHLITDKKYFKAQRKYQKRQKKKVWKIEML
jgi:adenine-specific DNA-methyltransferase